MTPVIDGHNDILARAYENADFDFLTGTGAWHLDLDGAFEAGFASGLFAIFIPPSEAEKKNLRSFGEGLSTPGPVHLDRARRIAASMFSRLTRYAERSAGRFRIARTAAELEAALSGEFVAALPHMEGAEAIDRRLHSLE